MRRTRFVENRKTGRFGREEAIRIRETFQNKPAQWEETFDWSWPTSVREIGVGEAVMYRSNKWKKNPRDYESYKHVCESKTPWRLFAVNDFSIQGHRLVGASVRWNREKMPDTVAILALFLAVQVRLFERDSGGIFLPDGGDGEDGRHQIEISNAKLAAGRTKSGECFLCIYVASEGPKLFLFGEELDVEKDGIVG